MARHSQLAAALLCFSLLLRRSRADETLATEVCLPVQPSFPSLPTCPLLDLDDEDDTDQDWAPWTRMPFCGEANYCAYIKEDLLPGQGFSIITTPGIVAAALPTLEKGFALAAAHSKKNDPGPSYEVREVAGKQKGAVATRRIARGETIVSDYASVLIDAELPGHVPGMRRAQLYQMAVVSLPDFERTMALSFRGAKGISIIEDILTTNTFTARVDGRPYIALFPEIARINHACNPNAFTRFSQKTLAMVAVAFRDIEPGEEITVSYTDLGATYGERQFALKRRWGFDCTCSLCSASEADIEASDERRTRIEEIRTSVLDLVKGRKFVDAIALNEELLALAQQEGLTAHVGETYEILARLSYAAGNMASAAKYGRLALADLKVFGGPDSYDTVKDLNDLLRRT